MIEDYQIKKAKKKHKKSLNPNNIKQSNDNDTQPNDTDISIEFPLDFMKSFQTETPKTSPDIPNEPEYSPKKYSYYTDDALIYKSPAELTLQHIKEENSSNITDSI